MKLRKTRLKNGCSILTVPLKGRNAVSLSIWIKVGGRYENPRLNGISHFTEHLLFRGTPKRNFRAIKEEIEGKGGSLNAFTAEECTCYHAKVPVPHLFRALDVLFDMTLCATMRETDIAKERTVIFEEIKMVQDQPSQYLEEILDGMLWKNHPLGQPLTGTLQTIARIRRSDLLDFRHRFYTPRFMTVVTAGNVDHDAIVDWCTRHLRSNSAPTGILRENKPKTAPRAFRLIPKKTEQVHIALGVPGLPRGHTDQYALTLLNIILGGNMSSRLFNEVREEKGLAYEIGSNLKRFRDSGSFSIEAGVDTGKIKDALKAILTQCTRVKRQSVGKPELKRAKDFFLGQFLMGFDNTTEIMFWVGDEYLTGGSVRSKEEVESHIRKVTSQDLRRLAQKLFSDRVLNCAILGPLQKKQTDNIQRLLTFER